MRKAQKQTKITGQQNPHDQLADPRGAVTLNRKRVGIMTKFIHLKHAMALHEFYLSHVLKQTWQSTYTNRRYGWFVNRDEESKLEFETPRVTSLSNVNFSTI